jgi:hypothetical protein
VPTEQSLGAEKKPIEPEPDYAGGGSWRRRAFVTAGHIQHFQLFETVFTAAQTN